MKLTFTGQAALVVNDHGLIAPGESQDYPDELAARLLARPDFARSALLDAEANVAEVKQELNDVEVKAAEVEAEVQPAKAKSKN